MQVPPVSKYSRNLPSYPCHGRQERKPSGTFKIVKPKERQGKQHSHLIETRGKAKGKKEGKSQRKKGGEKARTMLNESPF